VKNKLSDLNDHLFAQLERLSDEDISGDKLAEEIHRAKAVTGLASQIIANGNLVLNGIRTKAEFFGKDAALPEIFPDASNDNKAKKAIPSNLKDGYQRE